MSTSTQPTPQLVVINESTHIDPTLAWNSAWAVGYQIRWQAGPLLKIAADVSLIAPGSPIPAGAYVLHLLDKLPEAEGEALGYHDEDGNEVPYGVIGVEATLKANLQVSEVLSHEALELLFDPHVNLTVFDEKKNRLYPAELCDPAQGSSYDLGQPYGRHIGITVADFVTNAWFDDKTPDGHPTSFTGALSGPFSLGTQGYLSYATTLPPNWKQEFGERAPERAKELSDRDDRVRRRLAQVRG